MAKEDSDELTEDEAIEAEDGADFDAMEEAEVDWKADDNEEEEATVAEAEEAAADEDADDGE